MDHTCGDFLSILTDLEPAPRIILQLTPVCIYELCFSSL